MKTLTKQAICSFYKYSGVMRAQEQLAYWGGRDAMSVLLFHRVTDEIPEDGLTVRPDFFRRLCEILRDRFHVIPLAELAGVLKGGMPPRRTIAITFDDCYRDNLAAARVLAEHGLPACFFVPTKFVGTDHVFPWDQGLARLQNLTWDDVKEIASLGHEIGSHSVSHADFGEIDQAAALFELTESRRTIEGHLGRPVRYFAYPFGGSGNFRPDYLHLTREAGYDMCFSGHGGFAHPGMFGQVLPREPVPCFRSLINLELHLTGCLDWFYSLKRQVGLLA